ncbi:DMT family transporter [Nocardioides insulae]|uniref:DMT family transporter n=1 Tax=Nocardioides insulae TaxID=394734 RepID=UPI0004060A3C|nr:SMR family transporter [Nocardioides insulae]
MTAALLLAGAILSEVGATLGLRMAALRRPRWYTVVVVGYLTAFTLLALTLHAGMPLGVAYGVWAATGVALTTLASRALFGEPVTGVMAAGIALIVGGVLLIEFGAAAA